jgi:acetyltransferase-like isoleucine patch superfamily enzyme
MQTGNSYSQRLALRQIRPKLERLLCGFLGISPASSNTVILGENEVIRSPRRVDGVHRIQVGKRTGFGKEVWLSAYEEYAGQRFAPRLVIGDDVWIGDYACITCTSSIQLGDGCVLADFVYITDTFHGLDPEGGPILRQPLVSKGDIWLGAGTFVGYHCCILPGVVLGEHCVVRAGSVVTHSFPACSMLAGSPARLIKRYSFERHGWVSVHGAQEDGR